MNSYKKRINSGIYLVIDPAMEEALLLKKLQTVLSKKIAAVQIWDHFKKDQDIESLLGKVDFLCKKHHVPVLINNRWEYLKTSGLDGIHFDKLPKNLDKIKQELSRNLIFGLTCENDLADVRWAAANNFDYISFCAMFPSTSAGECEIVDHETVKEAANIFKNLLFLSGGIVPNNLQHLDHLKFDGVAVISGVMNSVNPDQAIDHYHKYLNL